MKRGNRQRYTNPQKTDGIRDLGEVDIAKLLEKVNQIPETVWETENKKKPNKFGPLRQASHIVFRFLQQGMFHNPEAYKHHRNFPIWSEWREIIEPVIHKATADYGFESKGHYPRIMLARLPAGCEIKAHVDATVAAGYPHKIHVPLQSNPECVFGTGHEIKHLEVGKAYEVNNRQRHWARNNGTSDRIHLIFEYMPEV